MSAGLAAHCAGPATTLAHAWILRRGDGAVLGFTDHDHPLTLDGEVCEPASGFDRSAATAHAGLAVGDEEVAGALASARITAEDLDAGRWDGAAIEVHLVNWRTPAERLLLRAGTLGEVTRVDGRFRAEIRGPAFALDQPVGRRYDPACDADLGDGRCRVDLTGYTTDATIAAVLGDDRLRVDGAGALPAGWFARGRITFLDGALAGLAGLVDDHRRDGGAALLRLWRALPASPSIGDLVRLTAGCDKRFDTCRAKFSNGDNFRGFPHMPGRDVAYRVIREGGLADGAPVVP